MVVKAKIVGFQIIDYSENKKRLIVGWESFGGGYISMDIKVKGRKPKKFIKDLRKFADYLENELTDKKE